MANKGEHVCLSHLTTLAPIIHAVTCKIFFFKTQIHHDCCLHMISNLWCCHKLLFAMVWHNKLALQKTWFFLPLLTGMIYPVWTIDCIHFMRINIVKMTS